MRVAFVGLGRMGYQIASRLRSAGVDLAVFDASPAVRDRAGAAGFAVGDSAAAVAAGSAICFLCLPDERTVLDVVLGEGGIAGSAPPPEVLVDCTTSIPAVTRRLAFELGRVGTRVVDAPVSGGVEGARLGRLTAMVGGDPAAVATARPLLEHFASSIHVLGAGGSGHLAKLVNNGLSAAAFAATSEAVVIGRCLGVPEAETLAAVNAGGARSQNSEVKFPKYVLSRSFDFGFLLGLMVKDLTLLGEAARGQVRGTPLLDLTRELFRVATAEVGAEGDYTAYFGVIDRLAGGAPARPDGPPADDRVLADLTCSLEAGLAAVTAEALALARDGGAEIDRLLGALNAGSGRNEATRTLAEAGVLAGPSTAAALEAWGRIESSRRGAPAATPFLSVAMALERGDVHGDDG